MRIFIKSINNSRLSSISQFPIHGLIFTINQQNAEAVREIITQVPFYLPIIGELNFTKKYDIEEIIFFCRLNGIILKGTSQGQNYSCPVIYEEDSSGYNVILNNNDRYIAKQVNLNTYPIDANKTNLALNWNEFISLWPLILKNWSQMKGENNC
ncbi:MAG: hypothetical protein ACOYVD_05110 [Bacillota bacterium]